MVQKNKSVMVSKIRLWKSNYDDSEAFKSIKELDQKYGNFTHVKINATILNINDEQKQGKLYDLDIADTDILIIEMPKANDYVF